MGLPLVHVYCCVHRLIGILNDMLVYINIAAPLGSWVTRSAVMAQV